MENEMAKTIEPDGQLSSEDFYPAIDPETGEILSEDDLIRLNAAGTRRLLRMSAIAMGCDPGIVARNKLPETLLCTIIGHVRKTENVANPKAGSTGQPETFLALVGDFEGTNMQTTTEKYGQVFVASVLYLPGKMNDWVADRLAEESSAGRKRPGEPAGVQFSVQLFAEQSKNPTGYTYFVRPLREVGRADPLAALRTQTFRFLAAEERVKSLPAPPVDGEPR
jgi:hypothetical protein